MIPFCCSNKAKRSEEESRKVLALQRIPAVEKGWETGLLNMALEWWSEQQLAQIRRPNVRRQYRSFGLTRL